jgi:Ser/Thr protein kinase RdoA (MazF antagonist)
MRSRDDESVSIAKWTNPATIAEAHAWLRNAAASAGRRVTGPIEQPHVRPWSTVFRAPTDEGDVYLKLCGPSQDFEPALTALLARTAPDVVPVVLAIHPRDPWMLLADGGAKLRDVLSGPALLDAWAGVLPRYAELQVRLLGRDAGLLACGTPDRRLDHLPDDLRRTLDDQRIVAPATAERLRALLHAMTACADELASSGIGATAQHDDLHDANVLRSDARTVVFDWGDSSLTHPFLSLGVLLRAAAHRAGLATDDPAIVRLRSAYLEPWTALLPRPAIEEAADLAVRLSTLTRALTWHRVVTLDEGALEAEPAVMVEYLDMVITAFG